MSNLRDQFPNLSFVLNEMTTAYKGGFKSDNGSKMVYIMPLNTFGHHVGDNYFEFERNNFGFILSLVSKKGSKEIIRTPSNNIMSDLSTDEWVKFIDDLLKYHMLNSDYSAFASGIDVNNTSSSEPITLKPKCIRRNFIVGTILITLGLLILIDQYVSDISFGDLWPIILIVIGIIIVVDYLKGSRSS